MLDRAAIYQACWTGLAALQRRIAGAVIDLALARVLLSRVDDWPEAQLHLLAGELPCSLCGEWAPEAGPCPECLGDPRVEQVTCAACGGEGGSWDGGVWIRCPHACEEGREPAPQLAVREEWQERLRAAAAVKPPAAPVDDVYAPRCLPPAGDVYAPQVLVDGPPPVCSPPLPKA